VADIVLKNCGDYDLEEIKKTLKQGFELLGGLDKFIKKGEKVLLKPNALLPVGPETAVVTHPVFVKAVIQVIKEQTQKIFIGESPGAGNYRMAAAASGVKKVAEEEKAVIIDFKGNAPVKNPDKLVYGEFMLDKRLLEMDKIINLPKLKTHALMQMTLCVKNMYGIIGGLKKLDYHAKAEKDKILFAKVLVDIYRTKPPDFNIIDGITAMEGDGPGTGGKPVNLGIVIMGADGFAIDRMVPELVGADPYRVYTNRVYRDFVNNGKEAVYNVLGGEVKVIKKFEMPPDISRAGMFGFFINLLRDYFTTKPKFHADRCTGCLVCVKHCPVKALEYTGKKKGIKCDYKKCISCFCCHEMCPDNAVSIKKPLIGFR